MLYYIKKRYRKELVLSLTQNSGTYYFQWWYYLKILTMNDAEQIVIDFRF